MNVRSSTGYLLVFVFLAVLTATEVAVVYVPGIARSLLISALVAMALGKAGLVLFSYMHLGRETRPVKLAVLLPFILPAGYAAVLMAEAAWRLP